MNTLLWILQIVLALAFGAAGAMKLTRPETALRENMGWVDEFSDVQVKQIGGLEVLAAVGLILPPALYIAPVLCPIAAAGLVFTMIGAGATHLRRGEAQMVPVNLVLGAIALFIAIERFGAHSSNRSSTPTSGRGLGGVALAPVR